MLSLQLWEVIGSPVHCCVVTLSVRFVFGPGMSDFASNVAGYSITSLLLCCHLGCKD